MARKKVTQPARLKVTQLKSPIGFDKAQLTVLRSLGLRRIRHTVDVEDTQSIRGMLLKVRHLVVVNSAAAGVDAAAEGGVAKAAVAGSVKAGGKE